MCLCGLDLCVCDWKGLSSDPVLNKRVTSVGPLSKAFGPLCKWPDPVLGPSSPLSFVYVCPKEAKERCVRSSILV